MANDDSETGVSSLPKIVRIDDRNELLAKARAFLQTPSILAQDVAGRREFLKEKGLLDEEIASLLSELPPSIPPRTYPRPIPSRLPVILNAALKLLGILSGSSIVLLAIYFNYIFPKLAAALGARASLLKHQNDLMKRLTFKMEELKSPHPEISDEPSQKEPEIDNDTQDRTTAVPAHDHEAQRLLDALKALREAIPKRRAQYSPVLQDMSEVTSLISGRLYAPTVHSGLESEVRKEIRAAKGLLLNRKTFTQVS